MPRSTPSSIFFHWSTVKTSSLGACRSTPCARETRSIPGQRRNAKSANVNRFISDRATKGKASLTYAARAWKFKQQKKLSLWNSKSAFSLRDNQDPEVHDLTL